MSTTSPTSMIPPPYPATLTIDYPDRKLNRLTSFFRIFVAIPIWIILALMNSSTSTWGNQADGWRMGLTAGGLLFLPLVLMILFRRRTARTPSARKPIGMSMAVYMEFGFEAATYPGTIVLVAGRPV